MTDRVSVGNLHASLRCSNFVNNEALHNTDIDGQLLGGRRRPSPMTRRDKLC